MVEAMIRAACLLPWLLLALVASPSAAHRLDEYLQAMLVVIEPSGIQLQINLTPGIEVADQVLARIDRDDDGVISKDEAGAYAELLKRDLSVRLDGHNVGLKLTGYEFPKPSGLRSGLQIIQVEFTAICDFDAGPHDSSWKTATCLPQACISSTQRSPSPAPSR